MISASISTRRRPPCTTFRLARACGYVELLDIAALTRAWPSERWDELVDSAQGYTATAEVYYALHFTSLCYPTSVPEHVLKRMEPQDTAYLEQFGGLDQRPERWNASFFERMLLDVRTGELSSAVPRV
ncbi:hypothetical protein SALBM311S_09826 [Streptomyces alboniger]